MPRFTGRILKETALGVLFMTPPRCVWLPKAEIYGRRPAGEAGLVSLLIPTWLAERKGLRPRAHGHADPH